MRQAREHPGKRWSLCLGLVLVFAVGLAACAPEANRLREAQAAFSEAAAAENAGRLEDAATVTAGYVSAYESLKLLFADEAAVSSLRDDQLLGVTYALKALTEWKLRKFDKAKESAKKAKTMVPEQLFPRDRALMEAIPGLIKNDQAFALIAEDGEPAELSECRNGDRRTICRISALVDSAIEDYQTARSSVAANHPVQLYLLQSQLIAFANLRKAVTKFNEAKGLKELLTDPRTCEGRARMVELKTLAESGTDRESAVKLVDKYTGFTGLKAELCKTGEGGDAAGGS